MDQKVLDYFKPYLQNLDDPNSAEPEMLTDYALLKRTIITASGDSNPTYNAENELKRLKQVGSVAEYASNIRRITAILNRNDEARRSHYRDGLKTVIQNELCRRVEIPFHHWMR